MIIFLIFFEYLCFLLEQVIKKIIAHPILEDMGFHYIS